MSVFESNIHILYMYNILHRKSFKNEKVIIGFDGLKVFIEKNML